MYGLTVRRAAGCMCLLVSELPIESSAERRQDSQDSNEAAVVNQRLVVETNLVHTCCYGTAETRAH